MREQMRALGWATKPILPVVMLAMILAPVGPALSIPADELPSYLTSGGRAGDDTAEGFGDVLAPLYLSESGLVFLNPRFSFNDSSQQELNLGLGYRYLFPDKSLILGANIYYDSRYTAYDNHFNQLGLGLEMLGKWIDARANYYLPEDKKKLIDSYDTETMRTTRSTSWNAPYGESHQIKQDGTTTTVTTITRRRFERFEEAMGGFDVEAGLRLPVLQNLADIRVFGGYYDYSANFGEDINGFKGRLEIRVLPALIIDAEYFEDKELNGSSYLVGGRVCLPFAPGNLFGFKNPFEGFGEAFKKAKPAFANRLTEMVIRDLAIRTDESNFIEDESVKEVSATAKKDLQSVALRDDVTFVDGDNAGAKDGTAENPYDTIQDGVDNAFGAKNVYVDSAAADYRENVVLTDNTTLIGRGCAMESYGGRVFGGDAYPTVDGRGQGPSITMANNTTVAGMRVINTDTGGAAQLVTLFGGTAYEETIDIRRAGIYANDANNPRIACNNLVENNSYGAILYAGNVTDFRTTIVNNNRFINNDEMGLCMGGMGASGSFTTGIGENTFTGNGDAGLGVLAYGYDTVTFDLYENAANDNDASGILMMAVNKGGDITAVFDSIQANGNKGAGLAARLLTDKDILTSFIDITANNNTKDGIYVQAESVAGTITAAFDSIRASGNKNDGLDIGLGADKDIFTGFTDITANDNKEIGINMYAKSVAGAVTASFDPIQTNRNKNGLYIGLGADKDILTALTNVTANDNNNGIGVDAKSVNGAVTVFGQGNVVRNNGDGGVGIDASSFLGETLDFGGGELGSAGRNSIFGNAGLDMNNLSVGAVKAEQNWWGQDPPAAGQFKGAVDYTPWLTYDPNP